MKGDTQHMDEALLVKYLLGEADAVERRQVEAWIAQDPGHKKEFEQFRRIWEESRSLASKSNVDENAAWQRFRARVSGEAVAKDAEGPKQKGRTIPLSSSRWQYLRIAAIILLLIGAGRLTLYFINGAGMVTVRTADNTLSQTLPDGTVVTLNKRSSLRFPKHFGRGERLVKLEGEAFFDVSHDKSHPFVIRAEDVRVKVVGTSFNVKTSEDKTEVIVATGIVEVAKDRHKVSLKPNEKATVLRGADRPIKEANTDELYKFYKTKELICNSTPLWRVVEVLNDAYGAQIIISNPALKDLRLTTSFHDESLDQILIVVSETFHIVVERHDKTILLK